jgi:hypothetical protein
MNTNENLTVTSSGGLFAGTSTSSSSKPILTLEENYYEY